MRDLQGTGRLVRLIAARDRVRLLVWVAAIVFLVAVTAGSTIGLYSTQADLDLAAAAARDNPAALAFNGPDQGLDTIGGQVAFQVGAFGLVVVALMALLLVGRATRGEEDSGRLELVRSMPVGRHAPLAAGLLIVATTVTVSGVLTAASLVLFDLPVAGSIVFGAGYVATGFLWIGLTAVTAQISENPRVATGSAGAVLGAAYLLRAVGDMSGGAASWASPIGWAQKARPYAGEVWWPLGLSLALAMVLVGLAVVLAERRDFGSGMVAPTAGPPTAAPSLRSPLALALRMHRGVIGWWALATSVLGVVYGSLVQSIEEFIGDNEAIADMMASLGGASLTDSYLATSLVIIALMAAGPGLQIVGRLRTEEADLRAEPMLATPVSRPAWMGSHLAVGLAASATTMALGGVGLGAGYAIVGGGAEQLARLTGSALVHVPAIWLIVGIGALLFGVRPRWATMAWTGLAWAFFVAMFGALLELPQWLMDLSPFQHTPPLPADPVRLLPLALLSSVAAALVVGGLAGFRRRDLVTA